MNKKKSIAVAIVLALVLLIGGMLAYFTDTDNATNVFTLGEIDITLVEQNWVATNGQGVVPGQTIAKDPVVRNDGESPAFVFAEVTVPVYTDGTETKDLFTYAVNSGWTLMSTSEVNTTNKTRTYVYAYGSSSEMTSLAKDASTPAVFNSVTVPTSLTQTQAATASNTPNIVVFVKGIQAEGLTSTAPASVYALF